MTNHTPGPWTIETPMGDETPWIVEANKPTYEWRCIAMVPVKGDDDQDNDLPEIEALANARLIAAAPALLAAAEHVLAGLNARIDSADGHAVPVFNGIAELHAAINAAKGAT